MIAAIVDDLLFGSKIRAATDAAGEHVTFVRGAADPVTEAASAGASLVIVDLGRAGAAETIRELRRALGEAVMLRAARALELAAPDASRAPGGIGLRRRR